jgi:hypothetical protein
MPLFLGEFLWMKTISSLDGRGGVLDIVTTLKASFLESHVCGVVVGPATIGQA